VGAMAVAAAALALAGCGSSYGSSSNNPSSSPSSGAGPQTIATSSGSMGTFLIADQSRSVYLWEGDHGMASSCTSACASVWPPVTTTGTPKAGSGVSAADLGTIHRSDGTTQVTYKGHPLYYYSQDTSKGQTNGEGSNGFGARWWLVSPAGTAIMGGGSSPSSSPTGGYGY